MCMGLLFLWADEWELDSLIVSQQGYFTTSKEHEIRVCEPPSVFLLTLFSSLFLLYTALSVSSSLLLIFLHFCPSLFPSLLFSFLPSFLPPSWGKGRFKLWTKDTRRKTLQKHLKCFSPFSVLRNVIHTQGTVSKEAESSWLKPYNAHGSL